MFENTIQKNIIVFAYCSVCFVQTNIELNLCFTEAGLLTTSKKFPVGLNSRMLILGTDYCIMVMRKTSAAQEEIQLRLYFNVQA